MTRSQKRLLFFLSLLVFLTFDLMLLGAGVRALDAGLACPDWPLCFGKIIPDLHFGVWMEFTHRAIAGILMILYAVFWVLMIKEPTTKGSFRTWTAFGFFLLIAQALMGALTVLKLLESGIVTMHLALATVFLITMILMQKGLKRRFEKTEAPRAIHEHIAPLFPRGARAAALALPFLVFGQILLGGWVASTYAGMVCLDFPLCSGEFIPTLSGTLGIQVIHRLGAYTTALAILSYALWVWSRSRSSIVSRPHLKWVNFSVGMVFVQILLGVLNLKLLIPAWMTVLHLAGALVLLRFVMEVAYTAWQPTAEGERAEASKPLSTLAHS